MATMLEEEAGRVAADLDEAMAALREGAGICRWAIFSLIFSLILSAKLPI